MLKSDEFKKQVNKLEQDFISISGWKLGNDKRDDYKVLIRNLIKSLWKKQNKIPTY